MGWNEWPLIFFTVFAQCAIGAFWWCCVALQAVGLPEAQRARLERAMLAIWVMTAIAFVFSSAHLGSPLRAINAVFRFGKSALSNEVVFGSAFVVLGLLRWLMAVRRIGGVTVRAGVLWATFVASLAFLWSMSSFYLMPTVPTWDTPLTPTAFVLTALIGGGAVAATLFAVAGIDRPCLLRSGPVRLAGVALAAAIFVTLAQSGSLPSISSSVKQAAGLSPYYADLMIVRFLLLFVAIGVWSRRVAQGNALTVNTGVVCAVLVMIGEWVGRGVFYGLHMTVGLL